MELLTTRGWLLERCSSNPDHIPVSALSEHEDLGVRNGDVSYPAQLGLRGHHGHGSRVEHVQGRVAPGDQQVLTEQQHRPKLLAAGHLVDVRHLHTTHSALHQVSHCNLMKQPTV